MILKISKLLTSSLLLTVNVNSSYCMDANVNSINNNLINQYNNDSCEIKCEDNINNIINDINYYNIIGIFKRDIKSHQKIINIYYPLLANQYYKSNNTGNNMNKTASDMYGLSLPQNQQLMYQYHLDNKNIECCNQHMDIAYENINKHVDELCNNLFANHVDELCNNLFANNYNYINSVFSAWDTNLLNKVNNVLSDELVRKYLVISRTETPIMDEIVQELIRNDYNQLKSKYNGIINNVFSKYYDKFETFKNILQNIDGFYYKNYEDHKIKTTLKHTLENIIYEEKQHIEYDIAKSIWNNYHEIIDDTQEQKELFQILNNIINNHEVNKNIKKFFDRYIGENFKKLSCIFETNNDLNLYCIKSILQNQEVQKYISIGSVIEDISINREKFLKGISDLSQNKYETIPLKKDRFEGFYYEFMQDAFGKYNISVIYHNIANKNISSKIKQDIQNLLFKCSFSYLDLEHELNKRTSTYNLNEAYIEYVNNLFCQILDNIKNGNNKDKIIKLFFDNYIANNGTKISRIFGITDNRILNNINLILLNNDVSNYILKNFITEIFEISISTNLNMLFGGVNDPSKDRIFPANYNEFETGYLTYMNGTINVLKNKITNIKQSVDKIVTCNAMQENVKNTLKNYIHDMEHYIDNRLLEITNKNNIHNVYTEYLNYYKNKSNVNNNTQNDNNN